MAKLKFFFVNNNSLPPTEVSTVTAASVTHVVELKNYDHNSRLRDILREVHSSVVRSAYPM